MTLEEPKQMLKIQSLNMQTILNFGEWEQRLLPVPPDFYKHKLLYTNQPPDLVSKIVKWQYQSTSQKKITSLQEKIAIATLHSGKVKAKKVKAKKDLGTEQGSTITIE